MARMVDGMERMLRAYMTTLTEGESCTRLEIKMNFLRPVRAGRLQARARVRSAGRTVGLVERDALGEGGSACMVLRGEAAAGR